MRRLILLRHTKSSWASPDLEDIDRPLNKRGIRSAEALAAWFAAQGEPPALAYVSPARRTRETWAGLRLGSAMEERPALYEASPETILDLVAECPAPSLIVVGHNPGLAEAARRLAAEEPDHARWLDYPTGALTDLRFDVESFAQIADGTGRIAAFLTPHDLPPV